MKVAVAGQAPDERHRDVEAVFREHERLLWGICYRLTGVAADAEEIVQETFVRALERRRVAGPWRPWLVRVATNLSLDLLRARRRRSYPGPWLPSPIETGEPQDVSVPASHTETSARYEQMESVSFAFLLALEALGPRSRAVLILRDVFDYSAAEIAAILDTSEGNVRLMHLRARRRMEAYDRERRPHRRELHEQVRKTLERFLACLVRQDVAGLESLLADSAKTVTDAGGQYTALRTPLAGRSRVATFHLKVARWRTPVSRTEIRWMNGWPAAVIETKTRLPQQAPRLVLRCEIGPDGRICEIHSVLAPRKLAAIRFGAA